MNKSVYSYNCVILLWKLCSSSRSRFPREALIRGHRPALSPSDGAIWWHLQRQRGVYGSSECKGTRLSETNMGLLVRAPLQSSLRGDGALHTKAFLHAWPFDHEPKPCPIVRVSPTQSLGCLEISGRCSCSARRCLRSSVRRGCEAVCDTSSRDCR